MFRGGGGLAAASAHGERRVVDVVAEAAYRDALVAVFVVV